MPDDHTIGDTLVSNDSGSYRLRKMRTGIAEPLELLIDLIKGRKKNKALLRRQRLRDFPYRSITAFAYPSIGCDTYCVGAMASVGREIATSRFYHIFA